MSSHDDRYAPRLGSVHAAAATAPYIGLGAGASHRNMLMLGGHLGDIAMSLRTLVSICGGSRSGVAKALKLLRSDQPDSDASSDGKSESSEEEEETAEEEEAKEDKQEEDETDSKSQSSSRDERAAKRARSASPSVELIPDEDEEMAEAEAPASSSYSAVSLPKDIPAATKSARKKQKLEKKNQGKTLGGRKNRK